ncbi:MAG: hypothetical protein DMG44_10655, partial [Acidobacteria bacterium]
MIEWNKQTVQLKWWLSLILLVMACLFVYAVVFWIRSELFRSEYKEDIQKQGEVANKTLQGMMEAVARIKTYLFPRNRWPAVRVVSMRYQIFISNNFDAQVICEFAIKALRDPLHFWEFEVWVEPEADPAFLLDCLEFKVRDATGHPQTYLPCMESERRKKVMIYFLPQVESAEADPRTLSISYRWPRMFGRLDKRGQEYWQWYQVSDENAQSLKFEFYLEPGAGRALKCECVTPERPKESLQESTISRGSARWPGWIYEVPDAAPGEIRGLTDHQEALTRTRRTAPIQFLFAGHCLLP